MAKPLRMVLDFLATELPREEFKQIVTSTRGNNHTRLEIPTRGIVLTVTCSPSCNRWFTKWRCDYRRALRGVENIA